MIRAVIAVVTGVVIWGLCATGLDVLLRSLLPGYAAAEPQFNFTPGMMIARLAMPGAVPSIIAGFASAWIARGDRRVIAALAAVLFLVFLPTHYRLWAQFPVWYHLTFLGSLILLTFLGARLKLIVSRTKLTPHGATGDGVTCAPSADSANEDARARRSR
jgi:hypothetical protein